MTLWWTTALLTGLAGSLHCVGMCGPLALALPVGRFPVGHRGLARAVYHAGRLSAYGLLGAVVGSVGQGLLLANLQRPLSVLAGILLLGWVLGAQLVPNRWLKSVGVRQLTGSFTRLLRHPTLWHMTGLGFLNGLLPCGSVYLALVGALALSSPADGAMYLLFFGLGTLPAMLSVSLVLHQLTPALRRRFSRSLPVMTVIIALLLIGRGLMGWWQPAQSTQPDAVPVCHGTLR